MSNISIYNSEKQTLTGISFLKDVSVQIKIRDIKDISKFNIQVGSIMLTIINHLGIKEAVSKVEKDDVKEMILMQFKHLSLDEVSYAFKLERYGVYGDKTDHFQLFNAEYVSTVLNKYLNWKVETRKQNNLNTPQLPQKTELSQEEKDQQVIDGLEAVFNEYKETNRVTDGRLYLYEFFYKRNLLPKDAPTKNAVHKIACEQVKNRVSLTKEEKLLNKLTNNDGKPSDTVLKECKRISLERFFSKFTTFEQLKNKLIK